MRGVLWDFSGPDGPFELASTLEAARAGGHVHGVLAERGEGNDLQRQLVGGGEHHVRSGSIVVGAQPVRGCHTPAIPRRQAGKAVPGHGRRKVIANAALMFQEFGGYHSTDRVAPGVLRPAGATSVSIKSGEGIRATGLQLLAQTLRSTIPAVSFISDPIQDSRFRGTKMCRSGLFRRARFGGLRSARSARIYRHIWLAQADSGSTTPGCTQISKLDSLIVFRQIMVPKRFRPEFQSVGA